MPRWRLSCSQSPSPAASAADPRPRKRASAAYETVKQNRAACSGSGASDYEQTDAIPDRTVEFSWFVNRDCNINPGTYRLRVSWDMRRVGWPTKTTVALSNIFEVTR